MTKLTNFQVLVLISYTYYCRWVLLEVVKHMHCHQLFNLSTCQILCSTELCIYRIYAEELFIYYFFPKSL